MGSGKAGRAMMRSGKVRAFSMKRAMAGVPTGDMLANVVARDMLELLGHVTVTRGG